MLLRPTSRSFARTLALLPLVLVGLLAPAACGGGAAEPALLSAEELAALPLEGGISSHLPIRFSATVTNTLASRELRVLYFEVDGRPFEVRRRIAPGESRRFSFQWVYPEDAAWEEAGSAEISWRLVKAAATNAEP